MKNLHVIFVLIAGSIPMVGWSTVPDSLKCRIDSLKALTHSSELAERYAGEFWIAWELYDVDNRIAVQYARLAYKSSCEIGDSASLLKTGRLYGQLLRRVDKLDSAALILEAALPTAIALKDSIEQAKIHNALSIVYTYQGRYDLTLTNNLKSLEIWKSLEDTIGTVRALENTGVTYYKMGNYLEAERYCYAALRFPRFYNPFPLLTNLALVKIMHGDTLGFHEFNERALAEMMPDVAIKVCFQYSFSNGLYFMRLKNFDLANVNFREALGYAQVYDDFRLTTESKFKIAECYARLGDYSASMKMLEGLEKPLVSSRMNPLRLTYYDLLSDVLERRGQLKKALLYKRRYIELSDTVDGQTAMNKVLMARVKIDEEQSYQALSQQAEVMLLKEQVIGRQRLLILAAIGLLVVLCLLGLVVVRFYLFQKRISRDLDRRVLERTRELEQSEKELTINLGQQQALMELLSGKVQASLATLRGLWTIKFSENDDPIEGEFERAATELLQVPQIISRSIVSRLPSANSLPEKRVPSEHDFLKQRG